MGSSGRPYLAQSLSAVAIAALDGVVPVLGTATGEVVRHLVARYNTTPELRGLHRRTTTALVQWVQAEGLSEVEQGLSLATRTVGKYGLTHEQIAQESFDPVRVAARVLADAQGTDPDWGRRGFWRQRVQEDRHIVAERAVHEIYAALIGELRANEPVVLPALAVVLDEVGRLGLDLVDAAQDLGELRDALVRGATAGEVMAYLRTRIEDWDSPVWSGMVPSSIERRLTANTVGNGPGAESQDLTEQEALEHQEMLVVLGGPGSGKTWLARRYARNAAREALARLEAGANLDEVEIPLFTTWDQWAQTSGPGARETIVASSFDPVLGHSDIAGHDLSGQLQRTLVLAETRVLLIVDSLDEAADRENQNSQGNRLHSLASLRSERCRVVVTSRPSAWESVRGRVPSSDGSLRVVSLHELRTDDVEEFVEAWFATDKDRARALIRQLRDRPDLARAAVVPLILTFYCSIAGEGQPADVETLPVRRHALYARIVRRTFHHVDSSKGAGAVARDPEERMGILAAWAWHAVGNANTSTGLGNWGEAFTQPPGAYDDPALDAIAPKVRVDDEGVVTRRFQHRTLLEHFVAEYVAELPTDEAAEILFPHLWYDPDWAVAAPAAIAAHNRRRPGELLGEICNDFAAYRRTTSTAWTEVAQVFDCHLLGVAAESDPREWPDPSRETLDTCRVRSIDSMSNLTLNTTGLLARTAHWERSNAEIVARIRPILPRVGIGWLELVGSLLLQSGQELEPVWAAVLHAVADPHRGRPSYWVRTFLSFGPGFEERARARAVVLDAFAGSDEVRVQSLVIALLLLDPGDAERAAARAVVLETLAGVDPTSYEATIQVETLLSLEPGDEERARARAVVLAGFVAPEADGYRMSRLVKTLWSLAPSVDERATVRAVVLDKLPNTDVLDVEDRIDVLLSLGPTPEECARAWATVLPLALDLNTSRSGRVVAALLLLGPGTEERAAARAVVLEEVPDVHAVDVAHRIELLLSLGPSDEERARARTAVLGQLTGTSMFWAANLVGVLLTLGPSDEERALARASVFAAISHQDANAARMGDLVSVLVRLEPAVSELTQAVARAREVVLDALADADDFSVVHLAEAFVSLSPGNDEQAQARPAVLRALARADRFGVDALVAALMALGPSSAERALARAAVIRVLHEAVDYRMDGMVELLLSLGPNVEDLAQVRAVVLDALVDADWIKITDLVRLLLSLGPSGAERARAWVMVVETLASSESLGVQRMMEDLASLELGAAERAQVRGQARAALSNAGDDVVLKLVPGLRNAFTLDEWLDLLGDRTT